MSFVWKDNSISRRRFLDYATMRLGAVISALVRWPVRVWLVGTIVIVVVVTGFLAVAQVSPVNAAPEPEFPLDCLRCHTRVLKGHDKLGSGTEACWVCHDSTDMTLLRLVDGTKLSPASSPQLCGQCHQRKYDAWGEGTHGTFSVVGRVKCADCHDPHQPQMAPSSVSKPSPPASEPGTALDCLSCHTRVLKGHDKLGEGSEACWACHYNMEMGVLSLAGGETHLPLSDSPQLCGQCHQKRYEAWSEGEHGVPAWKQGEPGISGAEEVKCVNCHEPHQPQVALLNITELHPPSAPSPPPPPVQPLIILGISLLLIITAGVVVATRGEGL